MPREKWRHRMTEEQRIRMANLVTVLRELEEFGIFGLNAKAEILESDPETLRSVLLGEPMTDAYARFLECAAAKPQFWLDVDQAAQPLSQNIATGPAR
jgi:hypothetical protein